MHRSLWSIWRVINTNKQIIFKTSILRWDLYDCSDAYIVVKRTATVQKENNRPIDRYNRNLILKKSPPFISWILKTNNVLIDDAEDLDVAMPMYNLIEYNKNYSKISGTLWNYTRYILVDTITSSESESQTSITGKTPNDGNKRQFKFSVPLKHSSSFWRTLDIALINCEVSLTLPWPKTCVKTDETTRDADPNVNLCVLEIRAPTVATIKIKDRKLYVPAVTLSTENDKEKF